MGRPADGVVGTRLGRRAALLLLSGVVPLTGVAVVPIVAIVLGNTMTAVAVAARLAWILSSYALARSKRRSALV